MMALPSGRCPQNNTPRLGQQREIRNVKLLTDAIYRLAPDTATETELRTLEEILGDVGKQIQKMHLRLSEDERTNDAIQACYKTMIGAADDLEQQINADPPNKAELEASLATLTAQIEDIAPALDQDRADVETTRSLLADFETAYQAKMQELTQAKAHLQRAKAGGVLNAAR